MAGSPSAALDLNEQVARIDRALAETGKLIEEQAKLRNEAEKFRIEARKLDRDRALAIWPVVAGTVTATAALIGGTAAIVRLLFVP